MDSVIETVYVTLALIVLFLVPFVLFIVYLIKRNGFYVNVNCWFCNTWTKVLYADKNSFYCPACLQYNGFDEDGDYNKVIEAQHDTSVNKYNKTLQKTAPVTNGLCTYCNNNQRLKVCQLANFVPLNESNYDVEVEHFEKQLEKAYKLCKKCDNALKITIEKQHAWLFGNRLRNLQKKSHSLFDLNNIPLNTVEETQTFCLNILKYTIILFCVVVVGQTLDIQVNYPKIKINTLIPNILVPYTIFLKDVYNLVTNALMSIVESLNQKNAYLPKQLIFKYNNLIPLTCLGFLLQVTLVIWDRRFIWWKINQLLGWALLVITSLISFDESYVGYIKLLQAFCAGVIISSLISMDNSKKLKKSLTKKKFGFKKITKCSDNIDCSNIDDEISGGSIPSGFSKMSNPGKFNCNKDMNLSTCECRSPTLSQRFTKPSKVQNVTNLNSFTTARSTKTASVLNKSVKTNSDLSSSSELNSSLDNLHLSTSKLQTCTSPVFSVASRPILSPSKLKNVTQNSWAAGGFWKNDVILFPASPEFTNLSRSSSQTSGFVSINDPVNINSFNSLPPSREPSVCGDFERTSILSEPPYHFQPINSNGLSSLHSKYGSTQPPKLSLSPNSNQLYYKTDNNMFYPVLNQNNMLLIQGSNHSNNFESSFGNLSLKSFNINTSGVKPPPLFGKQPVVSSLFKNLPGISTQSYSFKTPQC